MNNITSQTIIGALSALQIRVPSASAAISEAIQHVKGGLPFSAIGCVDSLLLHDLPPTTQESALLIHRLLIVAMGQD